MVKADLMGTMLEKSSRKRKICRYQRPAKCCRATMTRDTTTSAPNRILVRQFTSRSNRPIWGADTGQSTQGLVRVSIGYRRTSFWNIFKWSCRSEMVM